MKTKMIKILLLTIVSTQIACGDLTACSNSRMVGEYDTANITIIASLDGDVSLVESDICSLELGSFQLVTETGKVYQTMDYIGAFSAQDSLEIKDLIGAFSSVSAERPIISAKTDIVEYNERYESAPSKLKMHLQLKDQFGEDPDAILASVTINLHSN